MTNAKQKLVLVALSVLATLFLVEITLRTGGAIHLAIQEHQNKISLQQQDSYRILCVGESTTFMGGENSYPSQLEEVLNNTSTEKSFRVINKGVPGIGTDYIAANLPHWIEKYDPDIVVAMMGINDHVDYLPIRHPNVVQHFKNFLKNLRIVKLGKWLKTSLSNRAKKQATDKNPSDTETVTHEQDLVLQKINETPRAMRQLFRMALQYERQLRFIDAARIYKRLLRENLDPVLYKSFYKRLADCYRLAQDYGELSQVMQKMLEYSPQHPFVTLWLGRLCQKEQAVQPMQNMLGGLITNDPDNVYYYDLANVCYGSSGDLEQASAYSRKARDLRARRFNPVTQRNYQRAANLLAEKNIKMVFMQYPLRDIENVKQMLRSNPNFQKIIFVDNEDRFREILKSQDFGDYFSDRFAGDFGHCTPKGNRMIAENLASKILGELSKK